MASLVNLTRLASLGIRACALNRAPELLSRPALLAPTNLWEQPLRSYKKLKGVATQLPWARKFPEPVVKELNTSEEDERFGKEVCAEINRQIAEDATGRLFAIVYLAGKQYKITESDLIVVRGYWPPNVGDQINLEKVMLVGSTDFTLVGRPILNRELVTVDATVIDKTFSHTVTHFRFRKRKQYRRIHFYRYQQTMVRINAIKINGKVDEKLEFEGLDRVY